MTSYHSGLIKISLPLPPRASFPCQWQINTTLNKHLLCQLMLNINLTALETHTHVSFKVLNAYLAFLLCVCVYKYMYIYIIRMKICLDTKNLELFIFQNSWVRETSHIPTCLCENKLESICKSFFFSQVYWNAIYISEIHPFMVHISVSLTNHIVR